VNYRSQHRSTHPRPHIHEEGIRVKCAETGLTKDFDILVGADGIMSTTRRLLERNRLLSAGYKAPDPSALPVDTRWTGCNMLKVVIPAANIQQLTAGRSEKHPCLQSSQIFCPPSRARERRLSGQVARPPAYIRTVMGNKGSYVVLYLYIFMHISSSPQTSAIPQYMRELTRDGLEKLVADWGEDVGDLIKVYFHLLSLAALLTMRAGYSRQSFR
jgi:hypothetical protein